MKAKISSYHGHHIHDFNVVVRNPLEHTDCAKRGDTLPSKLLVKVAHLLALIKNIWVPCHKFTVDVYLMEREIIIPYSSYKKDLKQWIKTLVNIPHQSHDWIVIPANIDQRLMVKHSPAKTHPLDLYRLFWTCTLPWHPIHPAVWEHNSPCCSLTQCSLSISGYLQVISRCFKVLPRCKCCHILTFSREELKACK